MSYNIQEPVYGPENSGWYGGARAHYSRSRRATIARSRAEDRKVLRFWRDNGQVGTVDCVVTWLNATFGTQVDDLSWGRVGDPEACPIANTIAMMGLHDRVAVDGFAITLRDHVGDDDGIVIDAPTCVRVFVKQFDNGLLPKYNEDLPY